MRPVEARKDRPSETVIALSELSVQSPVDPGVSRPMSKRKRRGLCTPGSGCEPAGLRGGGAMAVATTAVEGVPSRGAPGEVIHLNVGGKR